MNLISRKHEQGNPAFGGCMEDVKEEIALNERAVVLR